MGRPRAARARLQSPCVPGLDRLVSHGAPVGGAQRAEDWVVDRPPGALLLLRVAIHLRGDVSPAAQAHPHGGATSRTAMLAPREEVAACTLGGRALVVQALLVFEEAKATKAALAATLLTPLLLSAGGAHGLLGQRAAKRV